MRTLLLDGDMIAWDLTFQFPKDHVLDVDQADLNVAIKVERIKEELGANLALLCIGAPDHRSFRNDIYPAYKEHRERNPVVDQMVEVMRSRNKAKWKPGLEADDVMGILATHPTLIPGEKVVYSHDKDLLQIPGTIYNPKKRTWTTITPDESMQQHMLQTLIGDSSDGFPGCPGIGDKRASAAIANAESHDSMGLWSAVVSTFKSKGKTEDDALLQARVARICQHNDYDLAAQKHILWNPPNNTSSSVDSAG